MTELTTHEEMVGIAAGDGLGAMTKLLHEVVFPALRVSGGSEDGVRVMLASREQVLTTDVFSVDPLEFPGGDIGRLAVCGVVNDLAASGARADLLTVGLFISASLATATLDRVLRSLGAEAAQAGCTVVCGDTKVHQEEQPQLLITVTAIGQPYSKDSFPLSASRPGHLIGVSGPLGSHSIAVLSAREGLGFENVVSSDVGCLIEPFETVSRHVPFGSLRDLTRGGLIAALWEGASATGLGWHIDEAEVPVEHPVAAAVELLGLDPFMLTNEGTMLFTVEPDYACEAVRLLGKFPATAGATIVGEVLPADTAGPIVTMSSKNGARHVIPYPYGLGIPRLC